MYIIRDHESGNVIDEYRSLDNARRQLRAFIQDDIDNGIYTPNFYEIYDDAAREIIEVA